MFICEPCLTELFDNSPSPVLSQGTCELCTKPALCSHIPSTFLRPKQQPRDEAEEKLLAEFGRELEGLEQSGAGLPLPILTPTQAWCLLSSLQLALKHPGNIGEPAAFARQVAENLEQRLSNGRPAMAEMARRGWTER